MKHRSKKSYIFPVLIFLSVFFVGFYISSDIDENLDIESTDIVKDSRVLNTSGLYEFTNADTEKWKDDALKWEKLENDREEANRMFLEKCREGDSYNEDEKIYTMKEGYEFKLSPNYTIPKRFCDDASPSEIIIFYDPKTSSDNYSDTSQGSISLYDKNFYDLESVNRELLFVEPFKVADWSVYNQEGGTYYFQDQDYIFVFSDQAIETETEAYPLLEMISTFNKI